MNDKGVLVRSTPVFHLKDKVGRNVYGIHLMKQFGFVPEIIIVEKVHGQNNEMTIKAVLTEDEIKKTEKEDKHE